MSFVRTIFASVILSAAFPSTALCDGEPEIVAARERNALVKILALQEEQKKLYSEISNDSVADLERSRRISGHVSRYEAMLLEFPENVSLQILYAKFLRDIGEDEKAKLLFEKAEKLAPQYAIVSQQLGALLAESGDFENAFPRLKKAVELEPGTAIYHFQLGEFLSAFRNRLLEKKNFANAGTLDSSMQDAFRASVAIDPSNADFATRYAMSFYEIDSPNWREALRAWENVETLTKEKLATGTLSEKETRFFLESVSIHKARVLAELGIFSDAKKLLEQSNSPQFERSRAKVRKIISKKQTPATL